MGSFLKGIIEVCVFLLRFVLVNFSRPLRWGGRKKLWCFFILVILFCCHKFTPCTHIALAQKQLEPAPLKTKVGFSLGFHHGAVKPSVPECGIEAAKPQTPSRDPAQVFLESISGTLGICSILGLSPVLQHPIRAVNHQLHSRSCPALYRTL